MKTQKVSTGLRQPSLQEHSPNITQVWNTSFLSKGPKEIAEASLVSIHVKQNRNLEVLFFFKTTLKSKVKLSKTIRPQNQN